MSATPKVLICGFDNNSGGLGDRQALPVSVNDLGNLLLSIVDPLDPTLIPNVRDVQDGITPNPLLRGLVTVSATYGYDVAGNSFDRIRSFGNDTDANAVQAIGNLQVLSFEQVWNGATWDRRRGANVFKTATQAAVGPTSVWTPAAGKKFRLMGYQISVAGTLAATGVETITLSDGATAIRNHIAALIQTPAAGTAPYGAVFESDLGQGYLSAAANNHLNLTLGTALATGNVSINLWGTEE